MKLFLAGAEDKDWIIRISAGAMLAGAKPALLSSYYYSCYTATKLQLAGWLRAYNSINADWVMDSGLFTMMFGVGKGKVYTYKEIFEYTKRYVWYLNKIKYKGVAVEMDVHKILGIKSLNKLRKYIEDNWDVNKTMFVWHKEEGMKGLVKMAERYKYIAFSIPELRILAMQRKEKVEVMLTTLFDIVKKKVKANPFIHLLGCAETRLMLNSNYYSVDSTSWLSGVKYSRAKLFNGGRLQPVSIYSEEYHKYVDEQRDKLKMICDKIAKETKLKFDMNKYSENACLQACAYKRFNHYINSRYFRGENEN